MEKEKERDRVQIRVQVHKFLRRHSFEYYLDERNFTRPVHGITLLWREPKQPPVEIRRGHSKKKTKNENF
ncbi:hypothetical protein CEXT_145711 [Caerostris extrusa]|uniref:Uncharacterized protein n=1 Tax=Caerostris extrusa TaxID=172846 RepID=A0AAV4W938_CAEEX|nr:hypothetical protein CEXT_145711 [Caerostris extrusa]